MPAQRAPPTPRTPRLGVCRISTNSFLSFMAVVLSGARCLIVAPRHPDADIPDESDQEKAPTGEGGGGLKQEIRGISQQSRLEMARQMSQLSTPHIPYHLTLTYAQDWPTDKDTIQDEKRRINDACRRFEVYGFWRLEFQRPRDEEHILWDLLVRHIEEEYADDLVRWFLCVLMQFRDREASAVRLAGSAFRCAFKSVSIPCPPVEVRTGDDWCGRVPHWHMLVYSERADQIESFIRWWKRTTNANEEGCFVTAGDAAKAAWYMALHQVKKDEQSPPICVGRWWGKLNGVELKKWMRLDQIADNVQPVDVIWLKRLMRRKQKIRGSLGPQGFTWFLEKIQHSRVLNWVVEVATLPRDLRIRKQGFDSLSFPF